jgi:hypothetical protein
VSNFALRKANKTENYRQQNKQENTDRNEEAIKSYKGDKKEIRKAMVYQTRGQAK